MKRVSIRDVRLAALGAVATALAAMSLGPIVLDGGPPPRDLAPSTGRQASTAAQSAGPIAPEPAPESQASRRRDRLQRLSRLSSTELQALAREGVLVERLAALNLLWVRGEREQVEALAAADRELAAKVRALRSASSKN